MDIAFLRYDVFDMTNQIEDNETLPEYEFGGKQGVRGKYHKAYQKGHTVRIREEEGKYMTTIAVEDKYAEILTSLGDLQEAVNIALHRYTLEQISTKISTLRERETQYQKQYDMTYPVFAQRIAEDEDFIQQIEAEVSKTWELDLADWEFCHEGISDWTKKLRVFRNLGG